MTLLELRQKFVQLSGRYDLVVDTTDWADNGADFFISAGQKYIDKFVEAPETRAQIYATLSSGEYAVLFQNSCRSITSVMVNNSTSRFALEKVELDELKQVYSGLTSSYSGSPKVFAIATLRTIDLALQTDLGEFINLPQYQNLSREYGYRGLIIAPPVDESYVVEVSGVFMQKELVLDEDENWWTQEYPDVLLKAAMRELEIFNRNTQGVMDWERPIRELLLEIDKDAVYEKSFFDDQMEG